MLKGIPHEETRKRDAEKAGRKVKEVVKIGRSKAKEDNRL